MKKEKISFVIPTLNEEEAIGDVIDEIHNTKLEKKGYEIEIVIVDGYSKDKTREIAKKKGARVVVFRRGYGIQYRKGFYEATGDIIITGDADMTYPFYEAEKFLNIMKKHNLEFITTNRFAHMDAYAMSSTNKFGNNVLTFFTNLLFGIKLRDAQSGMWIFKRDILPRFRFGSFGMNFTEEVKIEAFKKSRAAEVPIRYRERVGEVKLNKFRDGFLMLSYLFYKRLTFTPYRRRR